MSRPEIFASVFEHFALVFLNFPEGDEVTLWKQDVETIILDFLLLAPQVRYGRASDRRATIFNRSQKFIKFLFRFLEFFEFHFFALGWKWDELVLTRIASARERLKMICKCAWANWKCAWAKWKCAWAKRKCAWAKLLCAWAKPKVAQKCAWAKIFWADSREWKCCKFKA